MAQLPPFTKALSDPNITSYDITTYSPNISGPGNDGTSYWNNGITPDEERAETKSFYNLTAYLMQTLCRDWQDLLPFKLGGRWKRWWTRCPSKRYSAHGQ